jgi:hypothetical protein
LVVVEEEGDHRVDLLEVEGELHKQLEVASTVEELPDLHEGRGAVHLMVEQVFLAVRQVVCIREPDEVELLDCTLSQDLHLRRVEVEEPGALLEQLLHVGWGRA